MVSTPTLPPPPPASALALVRLPQRNWELLVRPRRGWVPDWCACGGGHGVLGGLGFGGCQSRAAQRAALPPSLQPPAPTTLARPLPCRRDPLIAMVSLAGGLIGLLAGAVLIGRRQQAWLLREMRVRRGGGEGGRGGMRARWVLSERYHGLAQRCGCTAWRCAGGRLCHFYYGHQQSVQWVGWVG